MMPPAPLADDWLYWDPESVASYPHSRENDDSEPEQLDLFEEHSIVGLCFCRSELARE